MAIETLGEITEDTKDDLRKVLIHAYSTFSVYRGLFHEQGITQDGLTTLDSLGILQRLPSLTGQRFYDLADESITANDKIIDMETSSGTTGLRKRRVITHRDDASETRFLAKLFEACGVGCADRVACVDTGPLTLMVSFTRAFDALGVQEAYAYCASHDIEATSEVLARLDPTVIVTIPSILDRCLPAFRHHFGGSPKPSLDKIIYVGEPLSQQTRSILETTLGVQVFAYYGASETSAPRNRVPAAPRHPPIHRQEHHRGCCFRTWTGRRTDPGDHSPARRAAAAAVRPRGPGGGERGLLPLRPELPSGRCARKSRRHRLRPRREVLLWCHSCGRVSGHRGSGPHGGHTYQE